MGESRQWKQTDFTGIGHVLGRVVQTQPLALAERLPYISSKSDHIYCHSHSVTRCLCYPILPTRKLRLGERSNLLPALGQQWYSRAQNPGLPDSMACPPSSGIFFLHALCPRTPRPSRVKQCCHSSSFKVFVKAKKKLRRALCQGI